MTHEELLARLWIIPARVTELQHGANAVQALRAVVELHKPDDKGGCAGCPPDTEYFYESTEEYPCPTIQAIEKTLY